MVSSVIESLMQSRTPRWARIFLPLPSLATEAEAQERRDEYDHAGF